MSLFSSFFTSQQEQVQQEFNLGVQPLRSRKWIHFNWSHILFIDGEFHPTECLPKDVFKEILQFNDMEMLINQIFSLLFVAADRCKESVSPKAQLTLRNGIVLIYQMMRNYVQLYWDQTKGNVTSDSTNGENSLFSSSDLRIPTISNVTGAFSSESSLNPNITVNNNGNLELMPPNFTNEFFKNMVRILLLSGDERVFRPDVIESSNFLFAFLLNDKLYGPLFLIYINDLRSKFKNVKL